MLHLFSEAGGREAEPQPQVISVPDWTKVIWFYSNWLPEAKLPKEENSNQNIYSVKYTISDCSSEICQT